MYARFSLDGLENDGADIALMRGEKLSQRADVVEGRVDESCGQRLESFLLGGLRRGREGRERASVEAVAERDHERAESDPLRMQACQLDRAFVGLGS